MAFISEEYRYEKKKNSWSKDPMRNTTCPETILYYYSLLTLRGSLNKILRVGIISKDNEEISDKVAIWWMGRYT